MQVACTKIYCIADRQANIWQIPMPCHPSRKGKEIAMGDLYLYTALPGLPKNDLQPQKSSIMYTLDHLPLRHQQPENGQPGGCQQATEVHRSPNRELLAIFPQRPGKMHALGLSSLHSR